MKLSLRDFLSFSFPPFAVAVGLMDTRTAACEGSFPWKMMIIFLDIAHYVDQKL